MNIAFYTQQEITPYTGGIGRVTSILTDYFRHKYGWRVFSLFAENVPDSCTKAEVDGKWQGRLHDRFDLRRGIKYNTRKAAQFLKDNRVQLVIVQTSMDVPMRLRFAMHEIGYDAKIITCLHFNPGKDVFFNRFSDVKNVPAFSAKSLKIILKVLCSPIYKPLIIHLTKRCYRRAYQFSDRVCLLSESYKDTFCHFSGVNDRRKLLAMPNPLSFVTNFSEKDLNDKRPVALVVGRLSEYEKRISTIISVWGKFEKRYPESVWRLKIVGDGMSLADYKRQAKALGLQKCSFEGLHNPIPYYQESKLFLMTSAFEGFPMTLVEAQQYGCVPIAMNSFSSLCEIITHERNGMVVEYGNEKQFLSAMEMLMGSPEVLQGLAVTALKDCQRFSQDAICSQWENTIKEIVS